MVVDKQSRVEVIVLSPEESEIEEGSQTKEDILNALRQAWQEAKVKTYKPRKGEWPFALTLNVVLIYRSFAIKVEVIV